MKSLRILLLFALVVVFFSASAQSETGNFSPAAKEPGESKILLVDDDPDILAAMGIVLEARGYQLVTAPDGEEGLASPKSENQTP